MLALVGPAVFDGTFYPYVHNIQIRMEHLITGPDVKEVNCFSLKMQNMEQTFWTRIYFKVPVIQECVMSGKQVFIHQIYNFQKLAVDF